jgi:thiamine-monophosphate kinase
LIVNNVARSTSELDAVYQAHILPYPCLQEGRFLAASQAVSSAMDVSDGLSSDLTHLCAASKTGARIESAKLPISDQLAAFCARFGFDPVQWALAGGEDYTLLFTVRPDALGELATAYERECKTNFVVIGEMTDGQDLELVDAAGRLQPLVSTGWDHFAGQNK